MPPKKEVAPEVSQLLAEALIELDTRTAGTGERPSPKIKAVVEALVPIAPAKEGGGG